jgi:osmotically-inducible protein OsmY
MTEDTQDVELQRVVEAQLQSDTALGSANITVAVKDRVVTLAGFTRSFRQRRRAVDAVERVSGIAGIVDDIEVRVPLLHRRPDPEIARNAVETLKLELSEAAENLKVTVDDGFVVIEGQVGSNFEREEAELAIRLQPGVRGIRNLIRLKSRPLPDEIKRLVKGALERNALIDADQVEVEVQGGEVTLRGTVPSFVERSEAERVAWEMPGITHVQNEIRVRN